MTAVRQPVAAGQWQALVLLDGRPYDCRVFETTALADGLLERYRNALLAFGWTAE